MARHRQIADEARQAYVAGRMAEAELLYRSAASAALELSDRAAWFRNMVWAASATYYKGDAQSSLALFLEVRQSEPENAPQHEAWVTRKMMLLITSATRPERARLEQLLADLRSYATTHRVSPGDLPELEGELSEQCGDWRTALAHMEAAWQSDDGEGSLKLGKSCSAAHYCLQLGELAACRDWIAAFSSCEKAYHDFLHLRSAEFALRLALAEDQPLATLLLHVRTFTDLAAKIQRTEIFDAVRELAARAYLLDPGAGDPAAAFHPTRAELRRPIKGRQNVHSRYSAHLLHLDYRLACLRHAASVPAVDDLYYHQPQQVTTRLTPADPDQFQSRLQKARAAAQSTFRYARHLDALLECDYRQRSVQARRQRIEEIAGAVG